jgi:hypothetical protein
MNTIRKALFSVLMLGIFAVPAAAVPLMQLDIAGGVYDPVSQTVVATSDPFVLTALLTLDGNSTYDPSAWLADTYFVSMAIVPKNGPVASDLGSFSVNGTSISATSGMTYGYPPIEKMSGLQGWDANDLAAHDIYPTFFYQTSFQFSPTSTAAKYDSAVTPGGLVPDPNGKTYYYNFSIDTRQLDPAYALHFDMYDSWVDSCGWGCFDSAIEHHEPFTNDAQSKIPEASSLSMSFAGLAGFVGLGLVLTRRTKNSTV